MTTMLHTAMGAGGGTHRFGFSRWRAAGLLGLLIGAAGILGAVPAHAATISLTPTYSSTELDYTWTWNGTNYTVPTASEDYSQELWERTVSDGDWTVIGDNMVLVGDGSSTGEYYEYADLEGAGFGYDKDYLYMYWDVVSGDKVQGDNTGRVTEFLKGKYTFYFEVDKEGYDPFLVYVNGGTSVAEGSLYSDQIGAKVYQAGSTSDAYGTAISATCESTGCTTGSTTGTVPMTGFNTEISGTVYSRRTSSDYRIEVAVPLSLLGLTSADFADLLWAYAGVAVSNPSGGNNLFANDMYRFAQGSGLEYDTLKFDLTAEPPDPDPPVIPEPASLLLMGTGLLALAGRWRSQSASRRN